MTIDLDISGMLMKNWIGGTMDGTLVVTMHDSRDIGICNEFNTFRIETTLLEALAIALYSASAEKGEIVLFLCFLRNRGRAQ